MDSNTVLWLLVAGAGIWLFMRMMKGGGCCGGDDEKEARPAHTYRHNG